MVITEITLDPQMALPDQPLQFRIGQPAIAGGHIVEKITYNPDQALFNKGREVGEAVYAIFFEGIPERRVIKDRMVTSIELAKEKKPEANIPDLPQAAEG